MSRIDAFHLPGIRDSDIPAWHELAAGTVTVRLPSVTPEILRRVMSGLRRAQQRLHTTPVARVIAAIDAAAARLLDPTDPLRIIAESALPHLTGYTSAMIRLGLDRMAADWRAPSLERVIEAELGGADLLERVITRRGRRVIAMPFPLVMHVFAGNVPGVAVTSLVRALLVRSASIGKTATGEPLLAALFARALAEADAEIGDALAIVYWRGGDEALEHAVFDEADAIVAYGGAGALAATRQRAPAHTPVLDHGPRLSVGFVARDAASDDEAARTLAADAALAIATFDQQGCVSPHAIFIEEGALTAAAFADLLVRALADVQARLPRGTLTADEAAAIRRVQARAEFGAFARRGPRLVSAPDAPFAVLLYDAPGFAPSCLQRTVHVYPVPDLEDGLRALAPHRALLQSAALAGGDEVLPRRIAQSGFTRVTSFSRMPWPAAAGFHDGRGPLRELLRLVSVELP